MLGIQTYIQLASRIARIPFVSKPSSTVLNTQENVRQFGPVQVTSFSWLISPNTSLDKIKKLLSFFAFQTIIFNPNPERMLNNVYAITHEKKEIAATSSSNIAKKENDIFKLFPELTDDFFSNDLFLNAWAIDFCITNKLYEKATQLCKITIDQIIEKNAFNFPYIPQVDARNNLIKYCFKILMDLLQINSVKDQAYQIITSTISNNLNITNKNGVFVFLQTACAAYDKTGDPKDAKILERVLNNQASAKILYENNDGQFKACLNSLDKIDPSGKWKNEVYKKIDAASVEKAFEHIKKGEYNFLCSIINNLFEKAPQSPEYYHNVVDIAQELCKATKKCFEYYLGPKKELSGTMVELPGYQYQTAFDIAETLIEYKQKDLAQEVLSCLQERERTLAKQALQSPSDQESLKKLHEVVKTLSDKLKKE